MQATKFMNKLNIESLEKIAIDMEKLLKIPELNQNQLLKLEEIDRSFTELLITSEKKCKTSSNHWSDTLRHARLINKYWRIQSKGKINNIKVTLKDIDLNLPDVQSKWQGDKNRSPKCQLRRSINIVNKIKKESWEHRKEYLLKLHHRYQEMGEDKKSKAVHKIQKSEFKLRCQKICKSITKPRGETGGLTHLLIETDTGEKIIDNNAEIENELINRNIKHFAQAHNTPCASGEMNQILGNDGITEITNKALKGLVNNYNIKQQSKDILIELKQVRGTLPDVIPLKDIISGFSKWREKTVTSPSGKHLEIYRTLIKWHNGKYENHNTHQSTCKNDRDKNKNNKKASLAINIQHTI